MNRTIAFTALFFATAPLMVADASPKDDVTGAAQKLAASDNYSWHTTVESANNGRFRPGPTDGKTKKDGYTLVTFSFGDNTSEAVVKGTNGAIKADGDWQSLADATKDDGGGFNPTMFLARRMQNFKSPAQEAEELANGASELKLADGVYAGDLTESAAKERLAFFRPPPGAEGPEVSGAKGSVKFWVTDGVLSKYVFNVQGHVEFNGNGRDVNNTTTVEIKDIGKTKVEVPDDAKKKF
jgi:hypothetical protein